MKSEDLEVKDKKVINGLTVVTVGEKPKPPSRDVAYILQRIADLEDRIAKLEKNKPTTP